MSGATDESLIPASSSNFSNGPYPRILDTGFDYAAVGSVVV